MRTAMVGGTVKGDRGTRDGAWWDGLERGERKMWCHSGSECWTRYREAEFKRNFTSHMLTPLQMNVCHSLFYDLLKVYLRAEENLHSLLPFQELFSPFICAVEGKWLFFLRWHGIAWKCFAYCVTWFGWCTFIFWVLLSEKIRLLVFYNVKKMICELTSADVLLERATLLAKCYLANLHLETRILLFSVDKAEQKYEVK